MHLVCVSRALRVALCAGLVALCLAPGAQAQEAPPAAPPAPPAAPPPPAPPPAPTTVSVKQVQINVMIAETSEQGLRDLGTNLVYTRHVRGEEMGGSVERIVTNLYDPLSATYAVTLPAPVTEPGNPAHTGTTPPPSGDTLRPDKNPITPGIQTQNGAGITFSIIDSGRGTIDGVFRSIERRSDLDLVSKPELLVRDEQEALIHAGGQFPFQDLTYAAGRASLTVTWRDLGVTMRLRSKALSDDLVQINLGQLDVSDVARIENIRGVDLPLFSSRSQTGMVIVPNNQTLVIGGLTSSLVRRTERRVPIVGKLPLLGLPFRSRKSEPTKSHLLIFISPTIVDLRALKPEAESALNFWRGESGQIWTHSDSFAREIKLMEEEL